VPFVRLQISRALPLPDSCSHVSRGSEEAPPAERSGLSTHNSHRSQVGEAGDPHTLIESHKPTVKHRDAFRCSPKERLTLASQGPRRGYRQTSSSSVGAPGRAGRANDDAGGSLPVERAAALRAARSTTGCRGSRLLEHLSDVDRRTGIDGRSGRCQRPARVQVGTLAFDVGIASGEGG